MNMMKSSKEEKTMKFRTGNEIKEFNEALNKCTNAVWLMGPNDEAYNMKDSDEYINGILRLTESDSDQFGIFTTSYADEAAMFAICEKLAA